MFLQQDLSIRTLSLSPHTCMLTISVSSDSRFYKSKYYYMHIKEVSKNASDCLSLKWHCMLSALCLQVMGLATSTTQLIKDRWSRSISLTHSWAQTFSNEPAHRHLDFIRNLDTLPLRPSVFSIRLGVRDKVIELCWLQECHLHVLTA